MTRINAHIPPENLVDQHLFAEFREITRVCSQLQKTIDSGRKMVIPESFRLGTGHVSFFLDKGKYIHGRYAELYAELIRRNYQINNYYDFYDFYAQKKQYYNDYQPSEIDNQLIIDRITERLNGMNNIRYYGNIISKEQAIKLLIKKNIKIETKF